MLKKILSLTLIVIMLVFQIAAVPVKAADTVAIDNAVTQLRLLNTAEKKAAAATIVGLVWKYIQDHPTANSQDIYDYAKTAYLSSDMNTYVPWANIVENGVDGKLEESTVIFVIDRLLARKSIFEDYYSAVSSFYSNTLDAQIGGTVRGLLGLPGDPNPASIEAVFAAMLLKSGAVITLTNGNFVRVTTQSALLNILTALNVAGFYQSNTQTEDNINAMFDALLVKANEYIAQYGVDKSNIVATLTAFGFYYTPTPDPTPTPGGGSTTPSPSPSPSPSAAPINNNTTQEEVKNYVDSKAAAIESAKDTAAAVAIVKDVISETKALLAAPAASTSSTAATVQQSVTQLINKVMEKVNTETVAPTVSGTSSKAVVSTTTANELLNKINTIASTANDIKSSLDSAGADIKVEKVLKIAAASTDKNVTAAQVEMPSNIFAAAKDKDIDKIAIDTGIATISIAPDALSVTGSEKVSLSVDVVDKSLLPEDVQAAVGNETVYDFNAIVGTSKVSEFKKPLNIAVPYTLKPGENPKKVTVYYINDRGQLENVVGKYDEATGKVSFTTKHFSGYVVKYNNVTFSDLAATEWARTEIEAMAAKGIIQGMGDNKYAPKSQLTRAQFAKMIVNAFKLQNTTVQNVFTDVKDTDWFYSAVLSAYASGIIKGVTDTTFNPNANISRQDMAVMISRALVLLNNADANKDRSASIADFPDKADISSYAVKGFEMTAAYGIMIGNANGTLNPKGNATRAEAAIVLYRLFEAVD